MMAFGLAALVACVSAQAGPYAPAAGQPGTDAMHMEDTAFVAWADGYKDYVVGNYCDASWQTPEKAFGKAEGTSYDIVSLGQGGQITMTFSSGIANGDGPDFAVFENGISDGFLELGFVEVSSDGVNFFRFPNDSLTPSAIATYATIDPTNITGYASKYRQGYGTPFDLEELAGTPDLDVDNVSHVRIIDIVGDGAYTDTSGDVIYDPYPMTGSAGVDLDAIGIIHTAPEPASLSLIALGGMALLKRRRQE
jgi:hypothetical protein